MNLTFTVIQSGQTLNFELLQDSTTSLQETISLASSAMQPGDELTQLSSGVSTVGQVPVSDGAGGIAWDDQPGSGSSPGDMLAATYDPNAVAGDAFDMDNMVEGVNTKILTSAERSKLSNTSGTNTGDQDLSSYQLELAEGAFVDGDKTKLDGLGDASTKDSSTGGNASADSGKVAEFDANGGITATTTNIVGRTFKGTTSGLAGRAFDAVASGEASVAVYGSAEHSGSTGIFAKASTNGSTAMKVETSGVDSKGLVLTGNPGTVNLEVRDTSALFLRISGSAVIMNPGFRTGFRTALEAATLAQGALAESAVQPANLVPITLLNSTERKTLSTYDPDGVSVGATRVIQSDLPGILWSLVAADVTLDSSWIGQPYTVDPDGDIIVSMELANVTGTVPDLNVIGVSGGVPSIGDGITTGGRKVLMNNKPAGYATMTSIKTTPVSMNVRQSGATGVCYSINGGTPVYVAGAVGAFIFLTNITDPKGAPVDIAVWPATSATSGRVGDLDFLACDNNNLTSLDVSGLTALRKFNASNNSNLTSLDVSGLTALTELYCQSNNLTSLDVSGLTALRKFNASNNSNLESVILGDNSFDTCTLGGINFANCVALTSILVEGLFDGSRGYASGYNFKLANTGMTTDSVYLMLQAFSQGPALQYIDLEGAACDAQDGAPPSLNNGATYVQADVEALLTSKDYALVLTDGTLAP